jgi:hypothetical protein
MDSHHSHKILSPSSSERRKLEIDRTDTFKKNAITAYQDPDGYKGITHENISDFLRKNFIRDSKSSVEKLKKSGHQYHRAMGTIISELDDKMIPGESDTYLFRGIPKALFQSFIQTGVIVNKHFTSCSKLPHPAKMIGITSPAILRIQIPKYVKRHEMEETFEAEVLLERNTQILLTGTSVEILRHAKSVYNVVDCIVTKYVYPRQMRVEVIE